MKRTRRLGMDMMTMLFLSMAVIVVMIIPYINIPEQDVNVAPPNQGNLMAELYWDDASDADVDLWVMGDADNIPVGYSNKGGPLWNLLRDDLGTSADVSGRNMEISYTRGLADGEYTINVHLFNPKSTPLPIAVKLVVSMKATDDSPYTQLFAVNAELVHNGQEKTLARFIIYDGKYIADSYNNIPQSLRTRRSLP